MVAVECPSGFVTKSDLSVAFGRAGVEISGDQLERWRAEDLLPNVLQLGSGFPGGSNVFYPIVTIAQAIEIRRLIAIKRSFKFVGFELWWHGFQVHEKYWRPHLEERSTVLRSTLLRISSLIERAENDEELGDRIFSDIPKSIAPQAIKGSLRKIDQSDFTDAFHALLKALNGEHITFSNHLSDGEIDQRPQTIQSVLGFSQADSDKILGEKIQARSAVSSIVEAFSSIHNITEIDQQFFESENFDKFLAARNDIRNIFEATRNTHQALVWVYGSRAFGLKAARWFHDKAPPSVKLEITLLWMEVRESHSPEFLPSHEIEKMLLDSRRALEASKRFKALVESDAKFGVICTPKLLKKAFSNKERFAELCEELGNFRDQ